MTLKADTSVVPLRDRFDYWSSAAPRVMHPMTLDRDDHQRFSRLLQM